ncbi:MAG TPA: SpoIIE family protein phosphatase [Terracidiphilus sp.]|jgi:hypothetical protein|nr:SpoIIE family protein phosphatase [Terracidiphilus sp.]
MPILPLRRIPRGRAVPLLILLVLLATLVSRAQSRDSHARIGNSVVVLTGPWKFHPGDDPGWADAKADDSQWGTMDLTPPAGSYDPTTGASGFTSGWTRKGYPKLIGFAWYRLRVDVENDAQAQVSALALTMPIDFDDAYQVYVNGQLIGEFGKFNSRPVEYYNAQPRAFDLPKGVSSGPMVIAIRVWMDSATPLLQSDAGGLHGPPMLGQASAIDAMLRLEWDAVNRTEVGNLLNAVLMILAAILGIVLFWLDRKDPAYFWLAMACLATFLVRFTTVTGYYTTVMPMVQETVLEDVGLQSLGLGLWALFWGYWFRLDRFRITARLIVALVCFSSMSIALLRPPLFGSYVPVGASAWLVPVSLALKLALGVVLLWITYRGIRTRGAEGWLALAPVLLAIGWVYQEELAVIHVPVIARLAGITMTEGEIGSLLMLAIITILMLHRFIRSERERELWRMEIEQARQVQQVLIPEALPKVPGFRLASDYRPAQQVGGDFFQILPLEGGGVLAVIGDVSGKGMPAAMTVSLLVGTVRTLAHFTTNPGEILNAMNTRMMARTQGGFTTCLVLRLDAGGRVTMANAGHLPPYCDGKELAVEAGLPLGLSADVSYPEAQYRLEMSQQLTLLTDGVVEARSRSGELLGFERTAAMATESAASIAEAAQKFGQEDDITVLTLKRLAVGEEAATVVGSTILSPTPA